MVWFVLLTGLSVIVLGLGVRYLVCHRSEGVAKLALPLAGFTAGAVFLLRLVFCWQLAGSEGSIGHALKTVSGAVLHTLQSFSLDEDYDLLYSAAYLPWSRWAAEGRLQSAPAALYTLYVAALNLAAPVMSGSLVAALVSRLVNRLSLKKGRRREKYFFSELNDNTIAMAENLRARERAAGLGARRQSLLVFAGSRGGEETEPGAELRARAGAIRALCVEDDITQLRPAYDARVPVSFVLACADERVNTRAAARLIEGENWRDCVCATMYVHASRPETEDVVQSLIDRVRSDAYRQAWRNLRIVPMDDYSGVIEQLFVDEPLYLHAAEDACHLLILGGGRVGAAALKAAVWCGQMEKKRLRIRLVDRDAAAVESRLRKEAPELFDSGEYDIGFYPCPVESDEFAALIDGPERDAHYVLIALGSDDAGIHAAADLQRRYNTIHLDGSRAPVIAALVSLPELSAAFARSGADDPAQNRCRMVTFGSTVARGNLTDELQSRREKMALAVHLSYYGMPVFLPEEDIALFCRARETGYSFVRDRDGAAGISARYQYELEREYSCAGRADGPAPAQTELLALQRRLAEREGAIASFYDSIYNRASSHSSAVHLAYYLPAAGLCPAHGMPTDEERRQYMDWLRQGDHLVRIDRVEHRRWNAFMRSRGWRSPTEEEFEAYAFREGNRHDNKALHLHPCIARWDEERGITLGEEDLALYRAQGASFAAGRGAQLDELDLVSLRVAAHPGNPKTALVDFKLLDEVIMLAADKILSIDGDGKQRRNLV